MASEIIAQKITPNLWFDRQAEEAVLFYTSVFRNTKTGRSTHYGKEGFEIHGMPEGTLLTIEFELEGQPFVALNGGPAFRFNEAISFIVSCDSQEEVDYYWDALSTGGGTPQMCGWLKDRFGVSWQIVPAVLASLRQGADSAGAARVMTALMKMQRLDIAALQAAWQAA